MNILYVHTHDTGKYIEPYGYNVKTPNLLKLAKEGTLFRNAYCCGPTCSPSRAALLTGMFPHSNGMLGLTHRGFSLNDYSKHIVQVLNNYDYETVLCGVQHEASDVNEIGYEKIITPKATKGVPLYEKDIDNAKACADYIKQPKDKSFFLSFGMFSTHRPYPVSDINSDYVIPPAIFPDTKDTRKDFADFNSSAYIADSCIGTVLNALDESGLTDETLIIYTTDHGIAFPNMKCNLYDTGIGVSLILKYPNNKQSGKALDCLVSHIDVYPTICDLAGIEKPNWLQGKSLLPILMGEDNEVNSEIFSEVTYHAAYEPMRSIRTKRYKLIHYYEKPQIIPANIDDGYTKNLLIDNGFLGTEREDEMLFDLYLDPVERVNQINNLKYKDIYEDLSKRLHSWMLKTDDPLLKGRVKKPQSGRINKRTCISPTEKDYE